MPKQKIEELGSLSKFEKLRLNRLYSRGRAAYGSMELAFVDKLAIQNNGVNYLLVAVDIFLRFP